MASSLSQTLPLTSSEKDTSSCMMTPTSLNGEDDLNETQVEDGEKDVEVKSHEETKTNSEMNSTPEKKVKKRKMPLRTLGNKVKNHKKY